MRQGLLPIFAASATAVVGAAAASYDYIVVGSGPGGGPLACDLARAGYSTLLIEAGDDQGDNPTYSELGNFIAAGNDPKSRWDFWVKHGDDNALDLKYEHYTYRLPNGSFYSGVEPPKDAKPLGIQYPRAGTLGGCAMHNGGVCSLPADDDWNIIVNKTGDASWEAPKMRKYLEKIEKNTYMPAGSAGHGFTGYLPTGLSDVSWARRQNLSESKILREMSKIMGQEHNNLTRDILGAEPNKDQTNGFYGLVQHADKSGHRGSPNDYIKATLKDPKMYPLTVQVNTLVTRVLFSTNSTTPQAIGVEVMKGQSLYSADPRFNGTKGPISQIMANKEVIVSGGTFNSPQILKLSGVGPADELKKFNIPVVKDLPGVGENLGDNYEGSVLALGQAPTDGGLMVVIFKTPTSPKNRNIWAWCGGFSFEGFWPGFPTDYGPNQYECAMVHMGPKSQAGSIKLTSANPQDVPNINFHFFKNRGDDDLQELLDGAKMLRQAWQAAGPPVLPYNEKHPCPGTGAGNCTDVAQKEMLRSQVYSHHATSTCPIGAADDKMAVVDSRFRVHGVRNLRVVDASVFPVVPGAFPVVPTFMISAKAAEEIIADAGKV